MNTGDERFGESMLMLSKRLHYLLRSWFCILQGGVLGASPSGSVSHDLLNAKREIDGIVQRSQARGSKTNPILYVPLTVDLLRKLTPDRFHDVLVGLNEHRDSTWDRPNVCSAMMITDLCAIDDALMLENSRHLLPLGAGVPMALVDDLVKLTTDENTVVQTAAQVLALVFSGDYKDRKTLRDAFAALKEPLRETVAGLLPRDHFLAT